MPRLFAPFLAWRYFRGRRRSFVSLVGALATLGLVVGVAALVTVLSVMNGYERTMRRRIVGMTAAVNVMGFHQHIAHWRRVVAVARENPLVAGALPYVSGQGMLAYHGAIAGVRVEGVDPTQARAVLDFGPRLVAGRLRALARHPWGIVLGKDLALALGVWTGGHVVLLVPAGLVGPFGVIPRLRTFRVVGVFDAKDYAYDATMAFTSRHAARVLFGLPPGNVTGVRLRVPRLMRAPRVARWLVRRLRGDYYVSDWIYNHRHLFKAIAIEKLTMFTILLLIVAVAAFNIVASLVMVVTDKQGDIAILRTLGASTRTVMGVFVVQGMIVGVLGIGLGLVAGVLLAHNVEPVVLFLKNVFGVDLFPSRVYQIGTLPSHVEPAQVTTVALAALGLTFLATLYPAWRASRIVPVEILRHE
jgi:lipoprotein-releasing system permease protein